MTWKKISIFLWIASVVFFKRTLRAWIFVFTIFFIFLSIKKYIGDDGNLIKGCVVLILSSLISNFILALWILIYYFFKNPKFFDELTKSKTDAEIRLIIRNIID